MCIQRRGEERRGKERRYDAYTEERRYNVFCVEPLPLSWHTKKDLAVSEPII